MSSHGQPLEVGDIEIWGFIVENDLNNMKFRCKHCTLYIKVLPLFQQKQNTSFHIYCKPLH